MTNDPIEQARLEERDRCDRISTAVFLNRGTCKFSTDYGKGWNAACSDIHHRIITPGRCITQSPIPAMTQALQAVKRDGIRLSADTLTQICDALDELKTPKEL